MTTLPVDEQLDPLDELIEEALTPVRSGERIDWDDEIAKALVWKSELKN
jgi:hypothetical protein